jgi:hypothetical protein
MGGLLAPSVSAQQQTTAQAQGIRLTVLQVTKSARGDQSSIIVDVKNLTDQETEIVAFGTVAAKNDNLATTFSVLNNSGAVLEGIVKGISGCQIAAYDPQRCFSTDLPSGNAVKHPTVIDPQGSVGLTISVASQSRQEIGDTFGVTTQFAVRRGGQRAQWRIISINLANIRL